MRGTKRKISLPRRFLIDFMHASVRVPAISFARPIDVGPLMAARAKAGAAWRGSARPSVGEWTPPIHSALPPGAMACASAALSMRVSTPIGRAMSRQQILGRDLELHPRILILTTFDLDEYVYAALRAGALRLTFATALAFFLAPMVVFS